jgi:hypothetical protein
MVVAIDGERRATVQVARLISSGFEIYGDVPYSDAPIPLSDVRWTPR